MKDEYLSEGRTRQKMATRKHILVQTQHLLRTGNEISMDDVIRESGLSRATVYRYFTSIEILVKEAGLDINTAIPEELYEKVSSYEPHTQILKIQEYFNDLAFDHEEAFRKYLGAVLSQDQSTAKRGARRVKTLHLVMQNLKEKVDGDIAEKVINTATVLMGIEALVATRDVCGLSKKKSKETLQWALDIILTQALKPASEV